jgi:integrase
MYCRDSLGLLVLDPESITIPKHPRREVVYLTAEEVERFIRAIPMTTSRDAAHLSGLRFRALVEALLGSAMRIGELLSLDRSDIDFERKEAGYWQRE